jgi:hypothetical protein
MKNITFVGVEKISLQDNLLLSGLIVSSNPINEKSKKHLCIYKESNLDLVVELLSVKPSLYLTNPIFHTYELSEKEVNDYVDGKSFIDNEDIEMLLITSDCKTIEEWKKQPLVLKIYLLKLEFGISNIFFEDKSPELTLEDVCKKYLNE